MTNRERKQAKRTFINAGRVAWRMGISVIDNPYKEYPFSQLWRKGYYSEKNERLSKKS